MAAWRQLIEGRWQPKICSLVLLLSIVAAILPVPTVRCSQGKDTSKPFPCQNRPCGCASAEQCRKQCCCFSTAQKLAWAGGTICKANPVSAVASTTPRRAGLQKSCCASKSRLRQSDSGGAVNAPNPPSRISKGNSRAVIYVIAIAAQKCHGSYVEWTLMPWAIVSALAEQGVMIELLAHFQIVDSRSPIVFRKPPLPPPKIKFSLYS